MDILYTDKKVKQIFEDYLGMGEQITPHILSEAEIKNNLRNTGIESKNQFNYNSEYLTDEAGKNLEYANLLRRNLYSGGTKLLKFLGIQQALLTLNPRMNFILNPAAVPGLTNPNGIVHHTVDGQFLTYPTIVNIPETLHSSELAAAIGTNLGQIEGPDFHQAGGLANILEGQVQNLFNQAVGTQISIDPTKSKLKDRLKNFNNLGDADSKGPVENYLSMHGGGVDSWKLAPDGSVLEAMTRENVEKFKRMESKQGFDFAQEFLDFGSDEAQRNWETFNVKTSKQSIGVKWGDDKLHIGKFSKYRTNSGGTEEGGRRNEDSDKATLNILKEHNSDSIQEITNDQQFPFFFEEVGDRNPGWCILPATIKSLAENFTPSFSEGSTYIGRTERPVTYGGTSRTVSFSMVLNVEDPTNWQVYKDRLLWLAQRTYPKYHDDVSKSTGFMTIYKNAPLLRMTIGDLFYRVGGYLTQLSYNWGADSNMWEKSLKGNRLPLQCDISIGFTILHDEVANGNTQLYAFEANL